MRMWRSINNPPAGSIILSSRPYDFLAVASTNNETCRGLKCRHVCGLVLDDQGFAHDNKPAPSRTASLFMQDRIVSCHENEKRLNLRVIASNRRAVHEMPKCGSSVESFAAGGWPTMATLSCVR